MADDHRVRDGRDGQPGRPARVVTPLIVVGWVSFLAMLGAIQAPTPVPLTTAERLAGGRWWPTKASAPMTDYAGTGVCARCHQQQASSQAATAMARTAVRAADSGVLRKRHALTFTAPPYVHTIRTAESTSVYSVSDGQKSASVELAWAFGAGKVGQTFIFARAGAMHEARASYFGTLDALDVTPGRSFDRPADLDAALGRRLSAGETRRCFGCHSTALSVQDGAVTGMVPGVSCEACHGPGKAHANAMDGDRHADGLAAVVNPASFNPVDSVDFCGSCHGTYWDVTLAGEKGVRALRSQPFRLQSSRCWADGDRRLTCVACHDPHAPLETSARSYDARCLACHRQTRAEPSMAGGGKPASRGAPAPHAPACAAGRRDECSTCHMPKYRVPEMHFSFTDHLIRVVRAD